MRVSLRATTDCLPAIDGFLNYLRLAQLRLLPATFSIGGLAEVMVIQLNLGAAASYPE